MSYLVTPLPLVRSAVYQSNIHVLREIYELDLNPELGKLDTEHDFSLKCDQVINLNDESTTRKFGEELRSTSLIVNIADSKTRPFWFPIMPRLKSMSTKGT